MKKLFYKCYDCRKDITTKGEHYEIRYIQGIYSKHKSILEITICNECFKKRIKKTIGGIR